LLTYAIKRFLYKTFARTTTFANKYFHAKMQPTRGWMLEEYAKILVTEIAMV
jgi:hypothetical protein